MEKQKATNGGHQSGCDVFPDTPQPPKILAFAAGIGAINDAF